MNTILRTPLFILLITLFCHCQNNHHPGNDTLQTTPGKTAFTVDAPIDIEPLLQRFGQENVYIRYDCELKKEMTYLGVNTRKIFSFLLKELQIDSAGYDVTFICKDGYSPTVSLSQLLEGNGYIVTRDVHAKDGWDEKIKSEFSPAYLVWDIPENDHNHSFPYGIVRIQFVEKSREYLLARPHTAAKEPLDGFAIFKDKCIKCHAVNQEGGVMGPELNYPKNITEYWQTGQIKAFIKNPASFRLNSRMPAVTGLSDAQIDLIVQYLQFMRQQKTIKQ